MGLDLVVGALGELRAEDVDGFAHESATLARLNRFLAQAGLHPHEEPLDGTAWSAQMIGYSGLHDVRRFAAYLDATLPPPPPADERSAHDDVLEGYFAVADGRGPGIFSRLFGRAPRFRRGFDHLILHSDAEGYYLPQDFPNVLFPPDEFEIPGGMVGSVPRLLAELEVIARVLAIPTHLTETSAELWDAVDDPPAGRALWQRYARESFGCVTLREGCRRALARRAALVFA